MCALLLYQAIYLASHDFADVPSDFANIMKILYCLGLVGPTLDWLFIYFLITRMNEKVRNVQDPNLLETQDDPEDNDNHALSVHTTNNINVTYNDMRRNYSRPESTPPTSPSMMSGF